MVVTFSCGARFLWVDSFCIVQDDAQQKESNIIQMGAVYAGAVFTIAASRSPGARDGFLEARRFPQWNESLVFNLPYRTCAGLITSITLASQLGGPHELSVNQSPGYRPSAIQHVRQEGAPLDSRAWALQERVLSPRTLDFGLFFTIWSCRVHHRAHNQDLDAWRIFDGHQTTFIISQLFTSVSSTDALSLELGWERLIMNYTLRAITYSQDRLRALAGVASELQPVFQTRYCAGLWESQMPWQLLWQVAKSTGKSLEPQMRALSSRCLAPSRSWAALNLPVRYEGMPSGLVDSAFRIYEIKIASLEPRSQFGSITSGYLVITARTREGRLNKFGLETSWVLANEEGEISASSAYVHIHEDQPLNGNNLYTLLLIISNREGLVHFGGLCLCKSRGGTYQRVGVFFSILSRNSEKAYEWLLKGSIQTVTIV